MIDYVGGLARFELAHDGCGGTDLLLTQEGVNADAWQDVHAGWRNLLFPLKAWGVQGVGLRNHDPSRAWEHGYSDH